MHAALWISKTGLSAQDLKLATISNNLANAGTVGFKRDRALFQDLVYQVKKQPGGQASQDTQLPSGLQIGTGVRTVATQKLFNAGTLAVTEQALDMAINGRGFFQIELPDGNLGYTRDGQFHMDQEGRLVTSRGNPLQPEIRIPDGSQGITIGEDGTVSIRQTDGQLLQAGVIEVTDFLNPGGLQAAGNNIYLSTASSGNAQTGTPGTNGMGTVLQSTLENSNVNVVEELVNMIATQRTYEMNSKVIQTADQMLQQVSQSL